MTHDQNTQATPDKASIRAELDQTHAAYHELLGSLSEEDWRARSANPAWRVGQLMWHVVRGMEFFSEAVGQCRRGKAPNPPAFLVNIGNVVLTRLGSRGATPGSVAQKYDAAHAALLTCLDGVKDDEWQLSVTSYGTFHTIESTFGSVAEHYEEHQADILKGLGRM